MGITHITTLLKYGDALHTHRKAFHQFIGTDKALAKIQPTSEAEARRLVYRILTRPVDLKEHVRLYVVIRTNFSFLPSFSVQLF